MSAASPWGFCGTVAGAEKDPCAGAAVGGPGQGPWTALACVPEQERGCLVVRKMLSYKYR